MEQTSATLPEPQTGEFHALWVWQEQGKSVLIWESGLALFVEVDW